MGKFNLIQLNTLPGQIADEPSERCVVFESSLDLIKSYDNNNNGQRVVIGDRPRTQAQLNWFSFVLCKSHPLTDE